MPRSYCFEIRASKKEPPEIEKLAKVDEIICKWHRIPVDKERFSVPYELAVEWAFAALMRLGGTYIERRHVDWIAKKSRGPKVSDVDAARFRHFLTWLFLEKYRFQAWG